MRDGLPSHLQQLFGMFSRMGMHSVPLSTAAEFKKQLMQLARSEFIYKPSMALNWMRQGIPNCHYRYVWEEMTAEKLSALLNALTPTPEVISTILPEKTEELTNDEDRVMYFLQNILRGLSPEQLEKFLLFVTGSPAAPLQPIRVALNREGGLKRAPSASTCGRTLFISTAYDTLNELRRELLTVLQSEEAFIMSNV